MTNFLSDMQLFCRQSIMQSVALFKDVISKTLMLVLQLLNPSSYSTADKSIESKLNMRSQLFTYLKCKRYFEKIPPRHLPFDHISRSKVFEVEGIDLCILLFLKRRSEVRIVLFMCAVNRAMHLEVISNLSTKGFI